MDSGQWKLCLRCFKEQKEEGKGWEDVTAKPKEKPKSVWKTDSQGRQGPKDDQYRTQGNPGQKEYTEEPLLFQSSQKQFKAKKKRAKGRRVTIPTSILQSGYYLNLNRTERMIYNIIYSLGKWQPEYNKRTVRPGIKGISKLSGKSESTVKRCMRKLRRKRLLRPLFRGSPWTGSNMYELPVNERHIRKWIIEDFKK